MAEIGACESYMTMNLTKPQRFNWTTAPNDFTICLCIFQILVYFGKGGAISFDLPVAFPQRDSGPDHVGIYVTLFDHCIADYGGAVYFRHNCILHFLQSCYVNCKANKGRAIYAEGPINSFQIKFCHIHKARSFHSPDGIPEDAAVSSKLDPYSQINYDIQVDNFTDLESTITQGTGYAAAISFYVPQFLQFSALHFQNLTNSQIIFLAAQTDISIFVTDCMFNHVENTNQALFYVVGDKKIYLNNIFVDTKVSLIYQSGQDYTDVYTDGIPVFWAPFYSPSDCYILIYNETEDISLSSLPTSFFSKSLNFFKSNSFSNSILFSPSSLLKESLHSNFTKTSDFFLSNSLSESSKFFNYSSPLSASVLFETTLQFHFTSHFEFTTFFSSSNTISSSGSFSCSLSLRSLYFTPSFSFWQTILFFSSIQYIESNIFSISSSFSSLNVVSFTPVFVSSNYFVQTLILKTTDFLEQKSFIYESSTEDDKLDDEFSRYNY